MIQEPISNLNYRNNIEGINAARATYLQSSRSNGTVVDSLLETFKKVERAKQEWESAVDALPELICVIDEQGLVVRANLTAENWRLCPLVSITGRDFHELIHPTCEGEDCLLNSFIRRAIQKDSTSPASQLEFYDPLLERHLLVKVHPVAARKEAGERTAAIVIQDITERKEMEDALASYTNRLEVMNNIGEAILAASSTQEIACAAASRMRPLVSFDRAFLALRDYVSNELLVIDIYAEGRSQPEKDQWLPSEVFTGSRKFAFETLLLVEDLSEYANPSAFEKQLLADGINSYLSVPLIAQNYAIGAFILGSKQFKGFQDEQILIATEVGDLLAIATHQAGLHQRLEEANASLQHALEAKEEMIQNVSHELRTPLSIISGYANLMNEEAFGYSSPEQVNALDIMIGRVDQLEFLVTRLMTLQALDKNVLELEALKPSLFFQSLVGSWRLRAESDDIHLDLEVEPDIPEVTADQNLLALAVGTLLDNAIKFSPGHGEISIRVWAENRDLFITLADQGIGVPQHKLDQIFERFVQADGSSTRNYGGMGIGLALCHDIIKAHDGRIWAESEGPGKGSKFTIVLPIDNGLV